jgi:iron complex transport system substrate-binding protein
LTDRSPALALAGVLALSACRADPGVSSAPIAVVDDAGDTVTLRAPARRIVSLIPSTTEILVTAGLEHRVVGRTAWCDWPAEATRIPSVGDGMPPNLEAVLDRRPDLVLLYHGAANSAAAAQLRALGVPVAQLRADRVADIARHARLLGRLTAASEPLDRVAREFERDLADASSSGMASELPLARPSVLLLAWSEPIVALGATAFMSELLERAGGKNAFGEIATASAFVALETIVERDPAAVFLADAGAARALSRPEWRAVPAVRYRQVITPLEPPLTRAGLRAPAAVRTLRRRLAELAASSKTVTLSKTKDTP